MNTFGMDAQSYNHRPSTISTNALLSTGTGTQDNLATGSQATQTALVAEVELSLPPPYPYDYKGDTLTMIVLSWLRHQMETFSELLAICAGNSPVTGEFPTQMPVTWSFHGFF